MRPRKKIPKSPRSEELLQLLFQTEHEAPATACPFLTSSFFFLFLMYFVERAVFCGLSYLFSCGTAFAITSQNDEKRGLAMTI